MSEWTGTPRDYTTACLASMRWSWSDVYRFESDACGWRGTWRAVRHDDGRELTASNPRDLVQMVQADLAAHPCRVHAPDDIPPDDQRV